MDMLNTTTRQLQRLAALLPLMLTACFGGPAPFKQSGEAASKDAIKVAAKMETSGNNVASAKVSASATTAVTLDGSAASSSLKNAIVTIPPGALALDTNITLQQGGDIASTATASALGLTNTTMSPASPALYVQSSAASDPTSQYGLQLPMTTSASLALADSDPYTLYFIVYHVHKYSDNTDMIGTIPREQLTFNTTAGTVSFNASYFGSFQLAKGTSAVKAVETKTTTPIVTQNQIDAAPPVKWTVSSKQVNPRRAGFSYTVTGLQSSVRCVLTVFHDRTSPVDITRQIQGDTYAEVDALSSTAQTLYARFECQDASGRTSGPSPFTDGVALMQDPAADAKSLAFVNPPQNAYVNALNAANFGVNGTCQGDGRAISISGAAAASFTCRGGAFAGILNLQAAADGNISISAVYADNGSVGVPVVLNLIKGTQGPALAFTMPPSASDMSHFPISGTCSANGQTVFFTVGGVNYGSTPCNAGTFSTSLNFANVPTSGGRFVLTGSITDLAGNTNVGTVTLSGSTTATVSGSIALTPGAYDITVNISPIPANTQRLFCIAYQPAGSANWTTWGNSIPYTVVTIGGLSAVTAYTVKVDACGSATGNIGTQTISTLAPVTSSLVGGALSSHNTVGSPLQPTQRTNAQSWYDGSNTFIFGGVGFDTGGNYSYLNDLWQFSGASWTQLSPNISPMPRAGAATWYYGSNLYMMGGRSSGADLNDVLSCNPTNLATCWTTVTTATNTATYPGTFGGTGTPGPRYNAAVTTYSTNLYLFGGYGLGYSSGMGEGYLNDLWKSSNNGASWTWVNGSNTINSPMSAGNYPSGRAGSSMWYDTSSGSVMVFGGLTSNTNAVNGSIFLNDTWKFASCGSSCTVSQLSPGTQPGPRAFAASGFFSSPMRAMIFGGMTGSTATSAPPGVLSDAWIFDGMNWTATGISSAIPSARSGAAVATNGTNLILFGGTGNDVSTSISGSIPSVGALNDLYSIAYSGSYMGTNLFSSGQKSINTGTTGSVPGSRKNSAVWYVPGTGGANGITYLLGGEMIGSGASSAQKTNELWKYSFDGTNWIWNQMGTPSVSARSNMGYCNIGSSMWLFGGSDSTPAVLSDLWNFTNSNWTLVTGSSGTAPSAREKHALLCDGTNGNLWVMGGNAAGFDSYKFNIASKVWTQVTTPSGSYGFRDPNNSGFSALSYPGARSSFAAQLVNNTGGGITISVFGGYGYGQSTMGELGDLWMFDGANWTWANGAAEANISSSGNPLPRDSSVSWLDNSGALWVFGGNSNGNILQDLWKLRNGMWIYAGNPPLSQSYGPTGAMIPFPSFTAQLYPINLGSRQNAMGWFDSVQGFAYIFGGFGFDATYSSSAYSTLTSFPPGPSILDDLWIIKE